MCALRQRDLWNVPLSGSAISFSVECGCDEDHRAQWMKRPEASVWSAVRVCMWALIAACRSSVSPLQISQPHAPLSSIPLLFSVSGMPF